MAQEERFSQFRKKLESNGWTLARIRGSHHVFTKPGRRPFPVPVHGNKVNPAYVRQAEKLIAEDEVGEGD